MVFPGSGGRTIGSYGKGGVFCFLEQGWSKLRRFLLVKFRPGYVKESLSRRRGECRRCARCCAIFFKCPHLVHNICQVYERRYEQCGAFPIDARDVRLISRMGGQCGFSFEEGDK